MPDSSQKVNARFERLAQTLGLKMTNGLPAPQTPREVEVFEPTVRQGTPSNMNSDTL